MQAFRKERASWRAIIQLNVVRSIRLILDAMSESQLPNSPSRSRSPSPTLSPDLPTLSAEHLKLKMRLAPLLQIEQVLVRRLSPDHPEHLVSMTSSPYGERSPKRSAEFSINSSSSWKAAFGRVLTGVRASFDSDRAIDWEDDDPGVIIHACMEDMQKLWSDATVQALLEHQKIRLEEMAGL